MNSWRIAKGRIRALEYSQDGTTLFTLAAGEAHVSAWNTQTQELGFRHVHDAEIRCLSIVGMLGASGDKNGAIHLWDTTSGAIKNTLVVDAPGVVSLAIARGANGLAGAGPRAYWWNDPLVAREAGAFNEDLIPWRGDAVAVAASEDGRWLAAAAGGYDPCYVVRRLGTRFGWTRRSGSVQASAFRFSNDGRWMAVVLGARIELHEMIDTAGPDFTSELRAELVGHIGPIRGVAIHPDGGCLASGGTDGTTRVWSIPSRSAMSRTDHGVGTVSALCFAPDGKGLAVGGEKGRIVIAAF